MWWAHKEARAISTRGGALLPSGQHPGTQDAMGGICIPGLAVPLPGTATHQKPPDKTPGRGAGETRVQGRKNLLSMWRSHIFLGEFHTEVSILPVKLLPL